MADQGFQLGKRVDGSGDLVLDPGDLTTHAVIVGMTGSGKTGLGIVLLEDLEQELLDEVAQIDEEWAAKADAIEVVPIRLEATDVRVLETTLLWVPTGSP